MKQVREFPAFMQWHNLIDGDIKEEYYKYN
jgi:hypothetical protein